MIALYKYILEVSAKEEEELFQLKDNADTKANGHHKPSKQKPRRQVRKMSGIAAGRVMAGGLGGWRGHCVVVATCATGWSQQPWAHRTLSGDICLSLFGGVLGRWHSRSSALTLPGP